MPIDKTKRPTKQSLLKGEVVNFYLAPYFAVPMVRGQIELSQICGFQKTQKNKFLPVSHNCRYAFDVFVSPHPTEEGIYTLVNHRNDNLTRFLYRLGDTSKIEVFMIEQTRITPFMDYLINEILPKLSTSTKIAEVVDELAASPTFIEGMKEALGSVSKTKTGVPIAGLKELFGGTSPTIATLTSIVTRTQRKQKWDEIADILDLDKFDAIVTSLQKDKEVLERFLDELDGLDAYSDALSEFCANIDVFLSDAKLGKNVELSS